MMIRERFIRIQNPRESLPEPTEIKKVSRSMNLVQSPPNTAVSPNKLLLLKRRVSSPIKIQCRDSTNPSEPDVLKSRVLTDLEAAKLNQLD